MTVAELENKVSELKALLSVQAKDIDLLQKDTNSSNLELKVLEQVNVFLASQIQEKVSSVKNQLESLVNQGLNYVFGDDIRLEIKSDFKNNKTVFSLNILKEGLNEGQADAFGGGVLSIISLLLRISSIIITNTERFIVLDESLAFLSKQYQSAISLFLQKIAQQLNFTIVLVAHQQDLAQHADNIYQVQGSPRLGITFNKISYEDF